jgi:hypothetical protein
MITTPELIDLLASNAPPVRRLRPPLVRTALWLLLAGLLYALLALGHGLRPDWELQSGRPIFLIGIAASLATGVLAALAAFLISLPDRSPRWAFLPIPTLLVWISTVTYGCLTNWVSLRPDGMQLGETARCFATLLLVSVPLSLAMYVMLRHAARFRPTAVTLVGSVAVAALTASALSLFHPIDATVLVLIWNLGIAAMIVGAGGVLARSLRSRRMSVS